MLRITIVQIVLAFVLLTGISKTSTAQSLPVPDRSDDAISGSEFKDSVDSFSLENREEKIFLEIINGNVPGFLRKLSTVSFSQTVGDSIYKVTYYVIPDYLAVGSDEDYFLMSMTPVLAQKICNALGFTLPTKKMVDQIWSAALVKLAPTPIQASPRMITIPVMWQHNEMVKDQRAAFLNGFPLGSLAAGHKKDVIISHKIYGNPSPERVVIYGWHYQNGDPIQPVYSGHDNEYADYSHGIRLVQDSVLVNGEMRRISELLKDPELSALFSDEGMILKPFYPLELKQ
jgi:hypothetical protein